MTTPPPHPVDPSNVIQIHPSYVGHQPAASVPVCGTRDLTLPGGPPCGEPAIVHIRWQGDVQHPKATLACPAHAEQALARLAYWAHHPATAACTSAKPTWHDTHCTQEGTQ
ncbi:hypothetical protein [Actinacidiphila acididurans]|uniref:Uncharacterized protein n=1 Tax=Actinacidiphila acididurans TaxID=2784346 RepID=A0ABS2U6C5_9ACTN|nr:hypothetical protein [Actinacidiphila acididurans]MBM9510050.1 hypothetical protein [Actinacidiphila acididurans]